MKTIRYIIFALGLLLAVPCPAQNSLFDKYADMDGVTSVYISSAMFRMMPVMETAGLNLMNMKGKIEALQLVSTSDQKASEQMRKEFHKSVNKRHTELMRIKSADSNTRTVFYADMDGDLVKELLMISDAMDNFTVVLLTGRFTLQDIQEITKDIEK